MAELRTILQKIDEGAGVAWLTFNRPEKKNALSQRLMIEMIEASEGAQRQRQNQMYRHHRLGRFLFIRLGSLRLA